ncbi:MAG: VTT domain-containing protein [Bacillota bacterium]|nr:VTT domain-containing protein [Bacillota bacterium]
MIKKIKNNLPLVLMLVLAAVVAVLLITGKLNVENIITAVRDNKSVAFMVILALYLLKGYSIGVPYAAIAIGTALVFGIGPAIAINAVGTVLCMTASYAVGRYSKGISFDGVMEKNPKLAPYFRNAGENYFTLCFVTHALHLQTEVQGVLYGLMRVPYGVYISGTMLAMLPQLLCYTVIGNKLDFTEPLVWVFLASEVALITTGLIMAKRRILTKKD